jgi:sterol desaturase/sphingolipid hydroxylase (fatty acid hydroxylase superfamily)
VHVIAAAIVGGLQLFTAAVGLAASVWMIRRGEPANGRAAGSTPTMAVLRARLPLIAANLGMMWTSSVIALTRMPDRFPLAWPGAFTWAWQVLAIFLVEDACFYVWHRFLHRNKEMYRRIHRIHHQAWAPLPIEYIYVHPVEWMVGAAGPSLVLGAYALSPGGCSVWVIGGYLLLRQLHELNIHATSRIAAHPPIPLIGTPEDHALHHAKPTLGQYGSIFGVWDRVFGTRIGVGRTGR